MVNSIIRPIMMWIIGDEGAKILVNTRIDLIRLRIITLIEP